MFLASLIYSTIKNYYNFLEEPKDDIPSTIMFNTISYIIFLIVYENSNDKASYTWFATFGIYIIILGVGSYFPLDIKELCVVDDHLGSIYIRLFTGSMVFATVYGLYLSFILLAFACTCLKCLCGDNDD
jgi:hypothetical protein